MEKHVEVAEPPAEDRPARRRDKRARDARVKRALATLKGEGVNLMLAGERECTPEMLWEANMAVERHGLNERTAEALNIRFSELVRRCEEWKELNESETASEQTDAADPPRRTPRLKPSPRYKPKSVSRRMVLTDESVADLQLAIECEPYQVRDTKEPGFLIAVGKMTKTFRVVIDLSKAARQKGKKRETLNYKIGHWGEGLTVAKARREAKKIIGQARTGTDPRRAEVQLDGPTLKEAWDMYEDRMHKRGRRPTSIASNLRCMEILRKWSARSLGDIGRDRPGVSKEHARITAKHGPYQANRTMRNLSAVYNNALRTWDLPSNPVVAVESNPETPRQNGMGPRDVESWFDQLIKLDAHPRRKEMHWFMLLSGLRVGDVGRMDWEHVDLNNGRRLHVPSPKGGEKRAFDLPLSGPMVDVFRRLARAEAVKLEEEEIHTPRGLVFPARRGKLDVRERGPYGKKSAVPLLSHTGHALRASYITLATHAGVPEPIVKRLVNHAITGVTEGYVNQASMSEADFLRRAQDTISEYILRRLRRDQIAVINRGFLPAGMS